MENSLLQKYKKPQKQKPPPHPLSACAEEINKLIPFTKQYGRGFWLRVLSSYQKRHSKDPEVIYTELFGILKSLEGMDKKYPKGAVLTNKLKK